MAGRQGYRKLNVRRAAEALRKSAGLLTVASKRLGCHRDTLAAFIAESPELQAVRREIDDEIADLAENQLLRAIRNGDLKAICFFLRTKCRDRGYSERTEIVGANGGPVEVEVSDPKAILAERLDAMAERMQRRAEAETRH
jgi:hypothetical protein